MLRQKCVSSPVVIRLFSQRGPDPGSGTPESRYPAFVGKKCFPNVSPPFPHRGRRFLNGNEQYVISAQRRIRIFGKRFMESEMTSILVQGSDQNTKKWCFSEIIIFSTGNSIVNFKRFAGFRRI